MTRRARYGIGIGGAAVIAAVVGACADLAEITFPRAADVIVTPASVLVPVAGTAQLQAAVVDEHASLIVGATPSWGTSAAGIATVSDDGTVQGIAAGVATVTATAGDASGSATVIVFADPAAVAAAAGDGQTGPVNATLPIDPTVLVTDADGNPTPQAEVTFAVTAGRGSVSAAAPVRTGADGTASVSWTLGPVAEANELTATVAGTGIAGNPVTFTALATVGPPDADQSSLSASPTAIVPSAGASFSTITVTVRDAAGSTVAGASVQLAATGSGNTVIQPLALTDDFGQATGTLSSTVSETKLVSATVNGSVTVAQTASIVVSSNSPTQLVIATPPAGATANRAFTQQPVVEIRDAFGNVVPTASNPITASLVSGNGVLVGTATVSATGGVATFSDLVIRGVQASGDTLGTGPHQLQFASAGFASATSATFNVGVSHSYNLVYIYGPGAGTLQECSGCHVLTPGNTVNQASACAAEPTLVVPGDPSASHLYRKVEGTHACGVIMPPAGLLSQFLRDLVGDWIAEGANDN